MRLAFACMVLAACGPAVAPAAPSNATPPPSSHVDDATLADPLAFLNADADIVGMIDVAALRATPIYATEAPALLGTIKDLDKLRACLGFDPVARIASVAFSIAHILDQVSTNALVVRGVDGGKTLGCIASSLPGAKVSTDRGVMIVADGEITSAWAIAGSSTLVMISGKGASRDRMTAVLAGGAPLRKAPAVAGLLARVGHGVAAWVIVTGPSVFEQVASVIGERAHSLLATVTVTDTLSADAWLGLSTADQAASVVAKLAPNVAGAKSYCDRFDLAASGSDAHLGVGMTAPQVHGLLGMLGPMVGP